MSHKDWEQSKKYHHTEDTFEALIMGALHWASPKQESKLREAFPETWKEFTKRSWIADGYYLGEPHDEDLTPASNDDKPPF